MNAAQRHRGPDEAGAVCFEPLGAGLACARLSLIDLEHGSQPIANEDGTVHVVVNGEIYNHRALRETLAVRGHRFGSASDAEVVVHLYEDSGEAMLDRLEGMFALAVLDRRQGRLLLARDGPGMKPLYVAETSHGLAFASEAKALFAAGLIVPEPDLEGLDAYLTAGCVPAPLSMFRGVRKLRAGHSLSAGRGGIREAAFWRPGYRHEEPSRSDGEYSDELEDLLAKAVRSHLAADVPVGVFLSGGWDSSLVATLAAQQSGPNLKTFSVVFPEDADMDESRFSRRVAAQLGTEHHEIEFRSAQLPEMLSALVRHLDEPCTTAPAGVFYRLASLAAGHVKAVLSGEGADELFGGYEWVRLNYPYRLRAVIPPALFRVIEPWCPHGRARKALRILGAADDRLADAAWRRSFTPAAKRELLKREYRSVGPDLEAFTLPDDILATCQDSLQRRLAGDFHARLAEGILFMGDKVSMAHSLEVRVPFLDHELVDYALSIRQSVAYKPESPKFLLRENIRNLLPPAIMKRGKQGFVGPDSYYSDISFYRSELAEARSVKDGLIRRSAVDDLLFSGDNWRLWKVLVFEYWYRRWCAHEN
jgi:asparagine synthase (glutamine-hydrolysing)